jgi:hypothetical protein
MTNQPFLTKDQDAFIPASVANGSREGARDDRLREAIQSHSEDWIASSLPLLSIAG